MINNLLFLSTFYRLYVEQGLLLKVNFILILIEFMISKLLFLYDLIVAFFRVLVNKS